MEEVVLLTSPICQGECSLATSEPSFGLHRAASLLSPLGVSEKYTTTLLPSAFQAVDFFLVVSKDSCDGA